MMPRLPQPEICAARRGPIIWGGASPDTIEGVLSMKNARAALMTLLVLLVLVGVPTWVNLASHPRPTTARTAPPAPAQQLADQGTG
jgi:hypothetical protein